MKKYKLTNVVVEIENDSDMEISYQEDLGNCLFISKSTLTSMRLKTAFNEYLTSIIEDDYVRDRSILSVQIQSDNYSLKISTDKKLIQVISDNEFFIEVS